MFFLKLGRTLKAGLQNFYRNGWLSIATISVITVTLFIVNLQLASISANNLLLEDVKDRVSVSVYFNSDVSENDVEKVKDKFLKYQEVSSIEYISKEQALTDFQARNENNEILKQSLEELGINPFEPSLKIKAHNPDDYELIVSSIEQSEFKDIISSVNYHKYKEVIDGLNNEIKSNQKSAIVLGVTLSVIAVLITFNSIRITMYSYRQEIEIMRLVGASNNYIRMPFVWEGILYGFISVAVAIPLFYVYLRFLAVGDTAGSILPFSSSLYLEKFLSDYFIQHLWMIIAVQLALGIFLGVVSSAIAIGKYLKK
jgi:cell division transport system permease protein